jgi:hypothetical protein
MKTTSVLSALVAILALTSVARAGGPGPDYNNLKQAAIKKFIRLANDKDSSIGMAIRRINKQTEDGRNQDGTIELPITPAALQVVTTSAEEMLQPWHYANEVNGVCMAGGSSATFLILLDTQTGVHAASEFGTVAFLIEAKDNYAAKILKRDPTYFTCEDLGPAGESSSSEFGPVKATIQVTAPKLVKLPALQ